MSDFVRLGNSYIRKDAVIYVGDSYKSILVAAPLSEECEPFFRVETRDGKYHFAPATERDKFLADMGLDKL